MEYLTKLDWWEHEAVWELIGTPIMINDAFFSYLVDLIMNLINRSIIMWEGVSASTE